MTELPERLLKRNLAEQSKWLKDDTGDRAARDMSEWQPIETVPKDGSEVDLWCINITDGGKARFPGMYWWFEEKCWEDWHSYRLEQKWRPTHWMPPPAPPAT